MTRGRLLVGTAVLLLALVMVVAFFATRPSDAGMMRHGMKDGPGMMEKDGMMGGKGMMGMCPMHGGMMGGMMGRSSMAVQGNYLYVLAGNKIMKYDPNLKLIRETEIMDMEKMESMMNKMMEKCPMHKTMMEQMDGTMEQEAK